MKKKLITNVTTEIKCLSNC